MASVYVAEIATSRALVEDALKLRECYAYALGECCLEKKLQVRRLLGHPWIKGREIEGGDKIMIEVFHLGTEHSSSRTMG
jgi:hypothetical protein